MQCADVKDLLGTDALAECDGRADAQSLLTAPFSGQPCVWYRSTVSHIYWAWENHNGERRRERKKRTVSEQRSDAPVTLTDDSGTVLVDPRDATIDHPRKVFDEFEKEGSTGFSLDLGTLTVNRGDTIGFQREEWIIGPGEQLYVLGGVSDHTGDVAITKPATDRGELLISTRSEEQILGSTQRLKLGLFAGAGLAMVTGVALLVFAATLA
jgi:hypothetical protein